MQKEPRILLVAGDLNFYNSNKYTLDLFLATRGLSHIVVENFYANGVFRSEALREGEDYTIVNLLKLNLEKLPLGKTIGQRLNVFLFTKLNKSFVKWLSSGDHIVHYTFPMIPPVSVGPTHVVTIHDLMAFDRNIKAPWLSKANWRWAFKRYRKFPYIVTPTNYVGKEVEKSGLLEGKITVIHHAISPYFKKLEEDRKGLRKALGLPLDKRLVLSVSSGKHRKNLSVIAEAVERLGPEYRLVRVGPPAGNSITFQRVPPETLNMIYNASDVLLFPTTAEGFGYPAIEAMATGLPVVTSDIEVMREVCGDAAVFIEPTVEEAVKGVRDALAISEELSRKGIERAKEFSFERFRENYMRLYLEILPELREMA